MDVALGLLREFGPTIGGILIVVGSLALVVKHQSSKLEAAHEREIQSIKDGCAATLKAVGDDRDRGWAQSGVWQQQAERLAERYVEISQVAKDLSSELVGKRGGGR